MENVNQKKIDPDLWSYCFSSLGHLKVAGVFETPVWKRLQHSTRLQLKAESKTPLSRCHWCAGEV